MQGRAADATQRTTFRSSRQSRTGCSATGASGIRRTRSPTTRRSTIRFTVPADYTVVASGVHAGADRRPRPPAAGLGAARARPTPTSATQPLRYLGVVVSKFHARRCAQPWRSTSSRRRAAQHRSRLRTHRALQPSARATPSTLAVEANRRQQDRGRDIVNTAADILRLYAATVGDVPYDSDDDCDGRTRAARRPQSRATSRSQQSVADHAVRVRNDPALFTNFPEFYIAHEIAHQWWGQAVGWKNYHEQWLSEGFAQYFAALYAQRAARRADVFRDVLAPVPPLGDGPVRPRRRLSRLSSRAHQGRQPRVSRPGLQQRRVGAAHAAPRWSATTRSSRACGATTRRIATRRPAPKTCSARWKPNRGRTLDRFFERWIYRIGLPAHSLLDRGRRAGGRGPLRADWRRVYDVPVTVTLDTTATRRVDEIVAVDRAATSRSASRLPDRCGASKSTPTTGRSGRSNDAGCSQPAFGLAPCRLRGRRPSRQVDPRDPHRPAGLDALAHHDRTSCRRRM